MTDGNYMHRSEHLVMYMNVESQCCTPETNILLYANYTSMKNNSNKINNRNKMQILIQ